MQSRFLACCKTKSGDIVLMSLDIRYNLRSADKPSLDRALSGETNKVSSLSSSAI